MEPHFGVPICQPRSSAAMMATTTKAPGIVNLRGTSKENTGGAWMLNWLIWFLLWVQALVCVLENHRPKNKQSNSTKVNKHPTKTKHFVPTSGFANISLVDISLVAKQVLFASDQLTGLQGLVQHQRRHQGSPQRLGGRQQRHLGAASQRRWMVGWGPKKIWIFLEY